MAKKPPPSDSLDEKQAVEDAARKAQEKLEEARKRKAANIRRAYVQVANTEAGRIVFRHLMEECGFETPSVNVNPTTGEILIDNTVYNEARRNLWLSTRKRIPPKNLMKIEYNLEAAEEYEPEDE